MEPWDVTIGRSIEEIKKVLGWQVIKHAEPVRKDIPVDQTQMFRAVPMKGHPVNDTIEAAMATLQLLEIEVESLWLRKQREEGQE